MSRKTLEELENDVWPDDSGWALINRCNRVRKKPVDELTIEDLRVMIGQNLSLDHLMPIAIDRLEENPLSEGDFYPGDLLQNVIRCRDWMALHPEIRERLVKVVNRAIPELKSEEEELRLLFVDFLGT